MKFLALVSSTAFLAAPLASGQITLTETLDVQGGGLSLYRPGRILERLYTGTWTLDWRVSGTLFGGDASVGHTLDISGVIGTGGPDFLGGINQAGPIAVQTLWTSFQDVRVGEGVSASGSLQGSVTNFPGQPVVGGLPGSESWTILTAQMDSNTYVDGVLGTFQAVGTYFATGGAFNGTLQLTYEVFSHPSTLVCAGGSELASYGELGRLYFLHSGDVPPSTEALLVEGQPAPASSIGLCLGSGVRRVPGSFQDTSIAGTYLFEVDRSGYPMGTTSAFQLWYRTPTGSEFSDAIEVQVH